MLFSIWYKFWTFKNPIFMEKEMATHSSVLAWRIPGTGEPGGLPSLGSHRVGHNWSDLAAAATFFSYVIFILYLNTYDWETNGRSFPNFIFIVSANHSKLSWPLATLNLSYPSIYFIIMSWISPCKTLIKTAWDRTSNRVILKETSWG